MNKYVRSTNILDVISYNITYIYCRLKYKNINTVEVDNGDLLALHIF